jgi:hypothetical protein
MGASPGRRLPCIDQRGCTNDIKSATPKPPLPRPRPHPLPLCSPPPRATARWVWAARAGGAAGRAALRTPWPPPAPRARRGLLGIGRARARARARGAALLPPRPRRPGRRPLGMGGPTRRGAARRGRARRLFRPPFDTARISARPLPAETHTHLERITATDPLDPSAAGAARHSREGAPPRPAPPRPAPRARGLACCLARPRPLLRRARAPCFPPCTPSKVQPPLAPMAPPTSPQSAALRRGAAQQQRPPGPRGPSRPCQPSPSAVIPGPLPPAAVATVGAPPPPPRGVGPAPDRGLPLPAVRLGPAARLLARTATTLVLSPRFTGGWNGGRAPRLKAAERKGLEACGRGLLPQGARLLVQSGRSGFQVQSRCMGSGEFVSGQLGCTGSQWGVNAMLRAGVGTARVWAEGGTRRLEQGRAQAQRQEMCSARQG